MYVSPLHILLQASGGIESGEEHVRRENTGACEAV
jgi:hypothetical protein